MIDDVIQIPIKDYLESIGFATRKEGNKYFASSPFTRDSNWSFCVYPNNTYFDWSGGSGGNIINLVANLENISTKEAYKALRNGLNSHKFVPNLKTKPPEEVPYVFDYTKYVNNRRNEIDEIDNYARSRGILEGYLPGVFFTRSGGSWQRNPSVMFLHRNNKLELCGAKFRKIDPQANPRFSARGQLGMYILENSGPECFPTIMYVVESESSANSLWETMKQYSRPCVVLSTGGVATPPSLETIPEKYKHLPIKVIIDYDGNEALYQERLKLYTQLGPGVEYIKLKLEKGADINSLYNLKKMYLIEHLL